MFGNDLEIREMVKYLRNGFEIWEMAKMFEKWLRYIGHGLSV